MGSSQSSTAPVIWLYLRRSALCWHVAAPRQSEAATTKIS